MTTEDQLQLKLAEIEGHIFNLRDLLDGYTIDHKKLTNQLLELDRVKHEKLHSSK